jgi:hypothetical protein
LVLLLRVVDCRCDAARRSEESLGALALIGRIVRRQGRSASILFDFFVSLPKTLKSAKKRLKPALLPEKGSVLDLWGG